MKFFEPSTKEEKLSYCKSVGFRPGKALRHELEKLSEELSQPGRRLTISDILREGFTFYWPHIRTHLRILTKRDSVTPEVANRIVSSVIRVHREGLTEEEIDQALNRALAKKAQ